MDNVFDAREPTDHDQRNGREGTGEEVVQLLVHSYGLFSSKGYAQIEYAYLRADKCLFFYTAENFSFITNFGC